MEYEDIIRLKDVELEERASLLLKAKIAIEQLQEELTSSRKTYENQRKIVEQQAQKLCDNEQHLHLIESELDSKNKECTELLTESLELKRKINELQDVLTKVKDDGAANLNALKVKLKAYEQSLEAAQAEAKDKSDQINGLNSSLSDRNDHVQRQNGEIACLQQENTQYQARIATLTLSLETLQREYQSLQTSLHQAHTEVEDKITNLQKSLASEINTRSELENQLQTSKENLATEREKSSAESASWRCEYKALQDDWEGKLERCESSWSSKYDKMRLESDKMLDDCKREWTRKYYLTEGEWFKKLQAANQGWATKLEVVGREWMQRYDTDCTNWNEERANLQHNFEERLKAATAAHAAAVEEIKRHHKKQTAAAESKIASNVKSLERVWSQRLEAALAASEREQEAAQRAWEVALSERVQKGEEEVAEIKKAGQAAVAEIQSHWVAKLADEEKRWLEEKHLLDMQWSEKLHAMEKASSDAQAALRAKIEAQIASVTQQVVSLAQRDAKREAKRGVLVRQVAELRALSEDEQKRRCNVENALREASSIFKKELQDKNDQLDMLRNELRHAQCYMNLASSYSMNAALLGRPCSGCRIGPCTSRPASAGGWYGRSLSPVYTGPSMYMAEEGTLSPKASSPVKPTSAAVKAARAAEKEAAAMRAARIKYQQALLEQQEERTALLRSMNDALKEEIPGQGAHTFMPRTREKWKVEVATNLQDLFRSTPSSPLHIADADLSHFRRPRSAIPASSQPLEASELHSDRPPALRQHQNCKVSSASCADNPALTAQSNTSCAQQAQDTQQSCCLLKASSSSGQHWRARVASRVDDAVSRLHQLTREGH